MEKTVKELIEHTKNKPCENEYYIANIDDLDEIKQAHENELAEKDKLASEEAMLRINEYQKLLVENKELKIQCKHYADILEIAIEKINQFEQSQLSKADFLNHVHIVILKSYQGNLFVKTVEVRKNFRM